jgi:hypothetical protein
MQGQEITAVAGADYSASTNLGQAVYLSAYTRANGPTMTKCGANAEADGIITRVPEGSGYGMKVCVHGFCKAKLGGTVAIKDELKTDSNGDFVVAGGTSDDVVVAIAYEAGDDDDEVMVYKCDRYIK